MSSAESYFDGVSVSDVMQWVGVGTSATAAMLYFARWYYLTFIVLNEYDCIDFQKRSFRNKYELSEIQELACHQRDREIQLIKNVINSKFSQIISLWGADQLTIESMVLKSMLDSGSRGIILDFRGAVWVESLDAWMGRMEQTSNPLHLFVKQFQAMLSSLGFSSLDDINGNNDQTDEVSAKFVRFRTLLSEKVHIMKSLVQQEPNRPFVFVLMGIDRLMNMERGSAEHYHGNRYLHEYIAHFVNISDRMSPISVIACLSDNFWLNYWVRNDAARRKSWSIHIAPLKTEQVVSGISNTFHLPNNDKPWITEKDLVKVSKIWGNNIQEVMKVLRFLTTDSLISVDQLLSNEIQQFVLKWYMKNNKLENTIGDDEEDQGNTVIDDDERESAGDDSTVVGNSDIAELLKNHNHNTKTKSFMCDEMKIIQLIASSPTGKVPFDAVVSYKHRKYLKTIISMVKRNVLQLEMCSCHYQESSRVIAMLSTGELLGRLGNVCADKTINPIENQIEAVIKKLRDVQFMLSLKRPIEQLAAQYMCNMIF